MSYPAASVQFPAGSGILISILGLGVCPLCSVLCCLCRCTWHCAYHICICLVFWSVVCCSPTGIWSTGIWIVSPGERQITEGERKKVSTRYISKVIHRLAVPRIEWRNTSENYVSYNWRFYKEARVFIEPIVYSRGFQTVVRVPLVVRGRLLDGTP